MKLFGREVSGSALCSFVIGGALIAFGEIHDDPLLMVAGLFWFMMGWEASIENRMAELRYRLSELEYVNEQLQRARGLQNGG